MAFLAKLIRTMANDDKISKPKGIEVYYSGANITLRRRWFTPSAFLIPLGIFIVGSTLELGDLIPTIIMGVLTISSCYWMLCSLINKTDLEMTPVQIRVRTYPLPWFDNAVTDAVGLSLFLVRRRRGRGGGYDNLMYVDSNNQEKPLIRFMAGGKHSAYLCQMLMEYYIRPDP